MFRKFISQMDQWIADQQARLVDWVKSARYKMQHLPEANYDLGIKFAKAGKVHDAVFRFKFVLKLRPNWSDAWYQLGLCHMRLQQADRAALAFKKAVHFEPAHQDALYLLAVVAPDALPAEKQPTTMPARMIQGFFTDVGLEYAALEQQNKYQGPEKIVEALRPHLPVLTGLNVLDAGCGIGHLAMRWRKVAAHLIGIDCTKAMVDQAKAAYTAEQATLFDQVIEGDIRGLSQHVTPESQDVILCGNVLQFVGALDGVFDEFTRCLKPGGLLAITIEPYKKPGDSYGIVATSARFGHSVSYVSQMANKHGLVIKSNQVAEIYPKIPCTLLVLQKAGHAQAENTSEEAL
jgi:predicted TPR repeat methyltransferase